MTNQIPYFKNLNALRFLAFLGVFFVHRFHYTFPQFHSSSLELWEGYDSLSKLFSSGHLGVNFFFVLSGFLIGYILLIELKERKKINIIYFYIKRALRIWPLYFIIVFIGFFIYPYFFDKNYIENTNFLYYIFFLSNFDIIENGIPNGFQGLGVLWSVAVEEQFYLITPFVILITPKHILGFTLGAIILVSIIFRFNNYDDYSIVYFHSLSVMSNLSMGILGAWLIISFKKFKLFFISFKKSVIVSVYLIGVFLCLFRSIVFSSQLMIALEHLILSSFFIFIILEQNYSLNSFFKFGLFSQINYLGKISYGLYCYHIIALQLTCHFFKTYALDENIFIVIFGETLFALSITIIMASISYHFVEYPFLKMKNRLKKQ